MNETYAHLTGHRSWWVPDFSVWGDAGAETVELLASEVGSGERGIMFFQFAVGGIEQEVLFSNLTDHRTNALPATIDQPLVIVISKSSMSVMLVGEHSSASFKIAQMESSSENALVDLWIVEMGS